MTQKNYLVISGLIFVLVFLIHLYRAVSGGAFVVGMVNVPIWASWLAVVLAGFLAFWAYRLATASP